MRRFLIILFALLLPLQLAWAGAAAYCGHEAAGAASKHFGHHTHPHKDFAAAGQGESSGKTVKLPDLDCAVCHFAGSHGLVSEAAWTASHSVATLRYHSLSSAWRSAPEQAPDRPQWSRPA